MIRFAVLTNTTDVYVDSQVNYSYLLLTFMFNLSELCIILHDIF